MSNPVKPARVTMTAVTDGIVLGHSDSSVAFPGVPVMAFGIAENCRRSNTRSIKTFLKIENVQRRKRVTSATAIKEALLAVSKEMIACGLVEGTAGNVSARLPDGNVVLTPSSLDYNTMTLADLVVTDINGNVLEGERAPTSEKSLHLACLRKHADIGAVLHCHAMFATMFAIVRQPIPCLIEEFDMYVGGDVPVADYRLTGSDELAEEVSNHVADRGAVLMANHGLLCVGKHPADALKVAKLVERTAQITWGARMLGEVVPLPESTLKQFAPLYKLIGRLQ